MTLAENCSSYWIANEDKNDIELNCICVGTGRFLRSVLLPVIVSAGYNPALIQPRGNSFVDYMKRRSRSLQSNSFEYDTVLPSGVTVTSEIPCYGAFSFGTELSKKAIYDVLLPTMREIHILGVGVTEGGLASHNTRIMLDLYELLTHLCEMLEADQITLGMQDKICVVNTDNVQNNGSVLLNHMLTLAEENPKMQSFVKEKMVFLNSMVDRITSERRGSNGLVPLCEPLPEKAIVILDTDKNLPQSFSNVQASGNFFGLIVRSKQEQIDTDIALKLRIANGTHTCIAHAMALLGFTSTESLAWSSDKRIGILTAYLDALADNQIIPGTRWKLTNDENASRSVWLDWRKRLIHPHFGLSTFFITQNGPAKGGIRLGPTVADLIQKQASEMPLPSHEKLAGECSKTGVSVVMVYAYAALLRWLTPFPSHQSSDETIFRGSLQNSDWISSNSQPNEDNTIEYADHLRFNVIEGWYEFRCPLKVLRDGHLICLSEWLGELASTPQQPASYFGVITSYLMAPDGGDLNLIAKKFPNQIDVMIKAIATLYARMVAGDCIVGLLGEMKESKGCYSVSGMNTDCSALVDITPSLRNGMPLHFKVTAIPDESQLLKEVVHIDCIESVVNSEVSSTLIVDLHTHLLPPSHSNLCLWGIDELLTYHYLVSEYFMTAPVDMTPEIFYAMTKQDQADLIWKALFVERSPMSEACRGIVTTLVAFGLYDEISNRNLEGIRCYYRKIQDSGRIDDFSNMIFEKCGLRYCIMTNIPSDPSESRHWRPNAKPLSQYYKTSLRIDSFLAGDVKAVELILATSGYENTLEGARAYIRHWCDVLQPEYLMASTSHEFVLKGTMTDVKRRSVNMEFIKEPGAFAYMQNEKDRCDGLEDDVPNVINENSDLLCEVLMKVCEERNLPIALKIGAHRGLNPRLKAAGDGIVAFADDSILARLCLRFPKVRFLATFLSRNNQQQACVLALKFSNLHIYGCWWYCNTPAITREITKMRIEMLGTAFTAQHSDSRVLDQLLYKWPHARATIAEVLAEEYKKVVASGWNITRAEIRRDIAQLFGQSFETFVKKSSS